MITQHVHAQSGHGGVKDTLIEVRSKYWFVNGGQFFKKTLYRCKLKVYNTHPHHPLSEFQVKEALPFAYCQADYTSLF